ncbi:MAG TPA: hypothetical protein VGS41_10345, partial [Chthonomonadales bacterium]|nr:hypothetical protein [Chthonomonadales bacterium]
VPSSSGPPMSVTPNGEYMRAGVFASGEAGSPITLHGEPSIGNSCGGVERLRTLNSLELTAVVHRVP